jgi:hypothetical protein
MESINFQIGHYVRVYDSESTESHARIGMIAFINENNGTCDIVFNSKSTSTTSSQSREQETSDRDGVSWFLIRSLEPFEYLALESKKYDSSATRLKEQGNIIFGLRDYDKASELYLAALDVLNKASSSLSIGSEIIIQLKPNSTFLFTAMISSVQDDGRYEVEMSEDVDVFEDSVSIVEKSQIVSVIFPDVKGSTNGNENRILQRSLYINLSRCCMKRTRLGWAVRWINMAMAITRCIESDYDSSSSGSSPPIDILKCKTDEYFIRCRAFITANKLELAEKDARTLLSFKYLKSEALLREIVSLKEQRKAANRRLVKEVIKWVDSSMARIGMNADLVIQEED